MSKEDKIYGNRESPIESHKDALRKEWESEGISIGNEILSELDLSPESLYAEKTDTQSADHDAIEDEIGSHENPEASPLINMELLGNRKGKHRTTNKVNYSMNIELVDESKEKTEIIDVHKAEIDNVPEQSISSTMQESRDSFLADAQKDWEDQVRSTRESEKECLRLEESYHLHEIDESLIEEIGDMVPERLFPEPERTTKIRKYQSVYPSEKQDNQEVLLVESSAEEGKTNKSGVGKHRKPYAAGKLNSHQLNHNTSEASPMKTLEKSKNVSLREKKENVFRGYDPAFSDAQIEWTEAFSSGYRSPKQEKLSNSSINIWSETVENSAVDNFQNDYSKCTSQDESDRNIANKSTDIIAKERKNASNNPTAEIEYKFTDPVKGECYGQKTQMGGASSVTDYSTYKAEQKTNNSIKKEVNAADRHSQDSKLHRATRNREVSDKNDIGLVNVEIPEEVFFRDVYLMDKQMKWDEEFRYGKDAIQEQSQEKSAEKTEVIEAMDLSRYEHKRNVSPLRIDRFISSNGQISEDVVSRAEAAVSVANQMRTPGGNPGNTKLNAINGTKKEKAENDSEVSNIDKNKTSFIIVNKRELLAKKLPPRIRSISSSRDTIIMDAQTDWEQKYKNGHLSIDEENEKQRVKKAFNVRKDGIETSSNKNGSRSKEEWITNGSRKSGISADHFEKRMDKGFSDREDLGKHDPDDNKTRKRKNFHTRTDSNASEKTTENDPFIVFPSTFKRNMGKRTAMKLIRRSSFAAKKGTNTFMSQLGGTYAGEGFRRYHTTVGQFVVIPLAVAAAKFPVKAGARVLGNSVLKKIRGSECDIIRTDLKPLLSTKIKSILRQNYRDGVEASILAPKNVKNLKLLHQAIEEALKERGVGPNIWELKKLLASNKIDQTTRKLIEVYLQSHKGIRYIRFSKIKLKRGFMNFGFKAYLGFRSEIYRMSHQMDSHMMDGVLLSAGIAKTGLKITYRSIKTAKSAATWVKRVASKKSKVVADAMQKASAKDVNAIRFAKKFGKNRFHGSSRFRRYGERMTTKATSSIAKKGTAKGVKSASKASLTTVKVLGKAAKAVVTTISGIVNGLLAGGPVVVMAAVVLAVIVIVFTMIGLFQANYSIDDTKIESTQKLVAQQYVDVLDRCYTKYRNSLESIMSLSGYETINISYKNEKNDSIYETYENTVGMVPADNNIKECLSMMSILFDFDLESYDMDGSDLQEEVSANDMDNLAVFMENNGLRPSDYRGNYQRLIRSYLIALFNGSHETTQRVEITYCQGCVEVNTGIEGADSYYICPGHRHLYVTVTTYYFDKLFSCRLKQNSDISSSLNVIGSNNVEKVWNGLISAGYTEEAAAGVIGNLMWESGGGPSDIKLNAVESNGEGIGMVQWSYGRKASFLNYLSSKGESWPNQNIELQLEYMLYELEHGQWLHSSITYEYGVDAVVGLETFKHCTDVDRATTYFCACFERCHYNDAHLDTRIQWAKNVYNSYHGRALGNSSMIGIETLNGNETLEYLGSFRITYYCPCADCSGPYGTQTSMGTVARENHTIAVDPNVIPYGSKIYIPNLSNSIVYTAEDCGGGVNGQHIDVYVESHAKFGETTYWPVYAVR